MPEFPTPDPSLLRSLACFSLAGKKALVAGASRGIGLAIAQSYAAAGADTVLAARSVDLLDREAAALRDQGYQASSLFLDMEDTASLDAAANAHDYDILVNVSGTNIRRRFEDYTEAEYYKIFQTNLHGVAYLTQKVGARMIARGQGGRIIQIGLNTRRGRLWGAGEVSGPCVEADVRISDLQRVLGIAGPRVSHCANEGDAEAEWFGEAPGIVFAAGVGAAQALVSAARDCGLETAIVIDVACRSSSPQPFGPKPISST